MMIGSSYRSLHRSKPLRSLKLNGKAKFANTRSLGKCSRYDHTLCLTAIASLSLDHSHPTYQEFPIEDVYRYEDRYSSIINAKKQDKSYRYFRNINRIAKEFPLAHSGESDERFNTWCTNDYVGPSDLHVQSTPVYVRADM